MRLVKSETGDSGAEAPRDDQFGRAERRAEVVAILCAEGNKIDRATLYADAFIEYESATANIEANGLVTLHPRTMSPLENPYLRIRDKAMDKIQKLRDVKASKLWGD